MGIVGRLSRSADGVRPPLAALILTATFVATFSIRNTQVLVMQRIRWYVRTAAASRSAERMKRLYAHHRVQSERVNGRHRVSVHVRVGVDSAAQPDRITLHVPADLRVIVPKIVVM
jgi:hypothetical protein